MSKDYQGFGCIHELSLSGSEVLKCWIYVDETALLRELFFIRDEFELRRAHTRRAQQSRPSNRVLERLELCKAELDAYGAQTLKRNFTLSTSELEAGGTAFQKSCYKAVYELQWGETASYKELACAIEKPRAYRACAQALRANQLLLALPCHRIVASGGIGGYWPGIWYKRILMAHEGIQLEE